MKNIPIYFDFLDKEMYKINVCRVTVGDFILNEDLFPVRIEKISPQKTQKKFSKVYYDDGSTSVIENNSKIKYLKLNSKKDKAELVSIKTIPSGVSLNNDNYFLHFNGKINPEIYNKYTEKLKDTIYKSNSIIKNININEKQCFVIKLSGPYIQISSFLEDIYKIFSILRIFDINYHLEKNDGNILTFYTNCSIIYNIIINHPFFTKSDNAPIFDKEMFIFKKVEYIEKLGKFDSYSVKTEDNKNILDSNLNII